MALGDSELMGAVFHPQRVCSELPADLEITICLKVNAILWSLVTTELMILTKLVMYPRSTLSQQM